MDKLWVLSLFLFFIFCLCVTQSKLKIWGEGWWSGKTLTDSPIQLYMEEERTGLTKTRALCFRRSRCQRLPKPQWPWRCTLLTPFHRHKHRLSLSHWDDPLRREEPKMAWQGLGRKFEGLYLYVPIRWISFNTIQHASCPAAPQKSEASCTQHLKISRLQGTSGGVSFFEASRVLSVTYVGNYSSHPVLWAVLALQK